MHMTEQRKNINKVGNLAAHRVCTLVCMSTLHDILSEHVILHVNIRILRELRNIINRGVSDFILDQIYDVIYCKM